MQHLAPGQRISTFSHANSPLRQTMTPNRQEPVPGQGGGVKSAVTQAPPAEFPAMMRKHRQDFKAEQSDRHGVTGHAVTCWSYSAQGDLVA